MLTQKENFHYDVIVIGAGHAGCEAAHASARLGADTLLMTMDMVKIAHMSCNPAIGGIAKGQIVREIDALGGMMGRITDAATLQFRMLNRSKGPAMWSPRAQCDNRLYSRLWRKTLESTVNLHIWQDEATDLERNPQTGLWTVTTLWKATFTARAVVITAGTFLNGLMHVGRTMVPGGRVAEPAATKLTDSIGKLGIRHERMKTGTPVRIDARSVHFEDMEIQYGEEGHFSFTPPERDHSLEHGTCWLTATNAETHAILRQGFDDSPLYNGQIQSIGPRYCPSIETKLHTFPDKDTHPLFLEPEGSDTNELYLNGFSSSLPLDIQMAALRTIPCFRDVKCYRPGYAIEYDFFPPTQLRHSLESKVAPALYFAGQVNGTTGYEEAAGQGLLAGINAARATQGKEPVILHRDEAYIGVLIDDLVTKGVDEPYRMFTSRAEFRILLRQDNADARLTPIGESIGLVTAPQSEQFHQKQDSIQMLMDFCRNTTVKPTEINAYLTSIGSKLLERGERIFTLVARPEVKLADLLAALPHPAASTSADTISDSTEESTDHRFAEIPESTEEVIECTETLIKYDGYIQRERTQAEKLKKLETIRIRGKFDYSSILSLSTEARQKLEAIDPETLAQASRIPGVSQSDIAVLMIMGANPQSSHPE